MDEDGTKLDYRDPEWVAEKLGIDKNTVYKYLQEGSLPGLQLGRKWLVSERRLTVFLERVEREQTERRRSEAAGKPRPFALPSRTRFVEERTVITSFRRTSYDPFARGTHPVGVRSGSIEDGQRGRVLPYEVWYPATSPYAGRDLDAAAQDAFEAVPDGPTLRQAAVRDAAAADGTWPLVLFSHNSGGHRRVSSFLTTHLASHGYVVAAVDHAGNTAVDMADVARRIAEGHLPGADEMAERAQLLISHRVPDVRLLLDAVLSGSAGALAASVDAESIGLAGWSLGGWAALATPEVDDRASAVVALVPAGASNPVPGVIPATLSFRWRRPVSTLLLAAENDVWTTVEGIVDIYQRTPAGKQMLVLRGAGHLHFGDVIEDVGGCPAAATHLFTRGLALAHFDAVLKKHDSARRFLSGDLIGTLVQRGVDAYAQPPATAG